MTKDPKQRIAEARRQYYRNWRAKNPEKVKAANERYWLRVAEREANKAEKKEETHDNNA